ncbi:response regulator [Saccharibacillus brassicae]|uniref:Response regulator n=1 Tax=Saccharibacillus brassicae TaxID=2583377 RepID=A0A4Y6UWN6_SACBS|nr:response regulator [Saccharibacillus brassicae]QDH21020.1 response regulator [Saccharibacillus brassicae]
MRAMLIDDEKPALMHLERLLRTDGRIEPAVLCTSAREGLERLEQEAVDAVFLDIGMPEMNGLEAAEYIQQARPGIAIIFVTAYSDYAVEAFDLQAIDYLLKPIGTPRLQKAIDRIVPSVQARQAAGVPSAPVSSAADEERPPADILTFRRLELVDPESGDVRAIKWRTAKAQELFAYLLHQGEQWVRRDELIDLLWPDAPIDKSAAYLHTSVYQLRKMLKEWNPRLQLEYRQESYRLLRGGASSDAELFERGSEQLPRDAAGRMSGLQRLLAMWRGGYLEQHDYGWAENRADELKRLRLRLTLELAERERESGSPQEAIRRLSALQGEEPFAEDVCRELMRSCEAAGDKRQAREHYLSLERLLQEELGVRPESQTERLYERIRS